MAGPVVYNCSAPSPTGLMALFFSRIWDSCNLEGQVHVYMYMSPRNRLVQLYPQVLGLKSCLIKLSTYNFSVWTTRKHCSPLLWHFDQTENSVAVFVRCCKPNLCSNCPVTCFVVLPTTGCICHNMYLQFHMLYFLL